jgi:tetratricopeptide (TPR) repeat protein
MTKCPGCKEPVMIPSFNTLQSMPPPLVNKYASAYLEELAANPNNKELNTSIAFCYLKLKLYDKALPAFEKAIEDNFDNSETFFYAAVTLLKGQKAFVAPRANIDKIEEYINAALMIEPKGIYYCFQAYIKYDYFHRKYLNTSPKWEEALQSAIDADISEEEAIQLFTLLGVEMPQVFE